MRLPEEPDRVEAIAELAQFEEDTSADLVVRTRRAIHRRTVFGHFTSFATTIPLLVLREVWEVLVKDSHVKGHSHEGIAH
jgi:hypothetical protein